MEMVAGRGVGLGVGLGREGQTSELKMLKENIGYLGAELPRGVRSRDTNDQTASHNCLGSETR